MKPARTDTPGIEVSVVVPVYNNAASLEELAQRLRTVFVTQGVSYEVIFVNDACPAGSLGVLQRLVSIDPRIAVLDLTHNVGQHVAVLIGLSYSRGAWCVIMDADLQDPPESIPDLLAKRTRDVAAVFAGRRGWYESPLKLFTSRVFKWLLHLLCGVPADAGLFVLLRRDLVHCLLGMRTSRPWIVALIGCTQMPTISLPVERARRPVGRSSYTALTRVQTALRAFACVFEYTFRPAAHPYLDRLGHDVIAQRIGRRFKGAPDAPTNSHRGVSSPPGNCS